MTPSLATEHRSTASGGSGVARTLAFGATAVMTATILAGAGLSRGLAFVCLVLALTAMGAAFLLITARAGRDRDAIDEMMRNERRQRVRGADELERASTGLEEAVQRERGAKAAAFDAMMTLSVDGRIETMNPAGERAFAALEQDLAGRSFESLVELDDRASLGGALRAAMSDTGTDSRPWAGVAHRSDGVGFAVEVAFVRQPSAAGAGLLAIVHDVSDRERVVLDREAVLAEAGHRLRTPLASITGALGLLRADVVGRLPKPAQNLVDIAHAQVQTLTHLVGELIDADGDPAPAERLDAVKIDLRAVFERARVESAAAFRQGEVRLDLDGAGPPVWAWGQEAVMVEVARSVLDEARRGSTPGGVVRVAFAAREDVVQVSVQNDSSASDASSAFSRLAQPDGATSKRDGGAQLLHCRSVVDRLGGKMFIASEPERPTRLYIDLPALAAAPPGGSAAAADAAAAPLPRVLICEDDAEVCELLRAAVKVQGGQSEAVCNLQQAQAALASGRFDLLIMDLRLPDGHGMDFLRTAPLAAGRARLPVVILSAEPRQPVDEPELNVVIADWLEKPIRLGVLRRAIRSAFDDILGVAADRRPTILHVEDDPDIRRLVRDLLRPTGDVIHAGSLFEARRSLASGEPDLIVLDIGLSDGSGLELMPILTNRRGERIPTIVFSGRKHREDTGDGVDHVFAKSRGSLEALAVQAHLLIGAGAQRHASQYEAA